MEAFPRSVQNNNDDNKKVKDQSVRNGADGLSKWVSGKAQPVKIIGSTIPIMRGSIKNVNVILRSWKVKGRIFLKSSKKEN